VGGGAAASKGTAAGAGQGDLGKGLSLGDEGWNNIQDGANISEIADSDISLHGVLLTGRESHGKIADIAGFDADEFSPFAIPEI